MKYVICDIDGTITDSSKRVLELKNNIISFDEFRDECGNDNPINYVVNLIELLESKYKIIFLTSRIEKTRTITEQWILKNVKLKNYYQIIMRENDDDSSDSDYKINALIKNNIKLSEIEFIIDDKETVLFDFKINGVDGFNPTAKRIVKKRYRRRF